jgi:hypothetical protein
VSWFVIVCHGVQVCDTIVTTVPKSVVHCLVRKAEKNLLNHMFGHVHKMSEVEIERMLQVRGWGQRQCCLSAVCHGSIGGHGL